MKTINIKELRVKEVILTPDSEHPLSVLYEILDDTGKVILTKRVQVKAEDMPLQAGTALVSLITRITERLNLLEEL